MNRTLPGIAALTALGTALALTAPARYEANSFTTVNGRTDSLLAWCDAPAAVLALTTPVGPGPNEDGPLRAELLTWKKTGGSLGTPVRRPVTLGPTDPGAGQVYTPLRNSAGQELGFLHTSTIEHTPDPAYRMTRVNEFKLGTAVYRCRYQPQAVFMGATYKRTVIVWDDGGTVTLATRNYSGTPGEYRTGGRKTRHPDGAVTYDFFAPDGSTYRVGVKPLGPDESFLASTQGEARKGPVEPFMAFTASAPAKN